jgi:hypothetical protein
VFYDYEETARPDLATAIAEWAAKTTPNLTEAEQNALQICIEAGIAPVWDRQILADALVAAADGTLTPARWEEQVAGHEGIVDAVTTCGIGPERLLLPSKGVAVP